MNANWPATPVLCGLWILTSGALTAQVARRDSAVPLKNWAAPLRWQPNPAEQQAGATARPELQFSANQVSADALTFVAITPCRLVDTRGTSAGFNGMAPFSGPSIPAGGTLTIPVQSTAEAATNTSPAPCGVIPSVAQAYSFNLTVVPGGGGSIGFVSIWPAGTVKPVVSTLNDLAGLIVSNAAIVPAGTPYGGVSVFNSGLAAADVIIDMNGYFTPPTDSYGNTAIGAGTLANNVSGLGIFNTASGAQALEFNTSGGYNVANGYRALTGNTTGGNNTVSGVDAMQYNTTGGYNTASGYQALLYNTTGNSNIAIGVGAAENVSGGNSNNIHIGSHGTSGDSGAIRIGTSGTQTSFFAAGVSGVTTGLSGAVPVVIDANGQLGTVSSSQRFKEDIQDMGDASSGLMRLRPVTFHYKQPYADGSKPVDYGLIAEEVAKIYPDLAVKGPDGEVETVQYQKLTPMLLNELQKQAEQIRLLEERLAALEGAK